MDYIIYINGGPCSIAMLVYQRVNVDHIAFSKHSNIDYIVHLPNRSLVNSANLSQLTHNSSYHYQTFSSHCLRSGFQRQPCTDFFQRLGKPPTKKQSGNSIHPTKKKEISRDSIPSCKQITRCGISKTPFGKARFPSGFSTSATASSRANPR